MSPALPRDPAKPLKGNHQPPGQQPATWSCLGPTSPSWTWNLRITLLGPPAQRHRQANMFPSDPQRSKEELGLKAQARGLDSQPRPTTYLPTWLQAGGQPLCASVSPSVQWGEYSRPLPLRAARALHPLTARSPAGSQHLLGLLPGGPASLARPPGTLTVPPRVYQGTWPPPHPSGSSTSSPWPPEGALNVAALRIKPNSQGGRAALFTFRPASPRPFHRRR